MAPQFTAIQGPRARFPDRWISCATTSLPVPVSPSISTLQRRFATSAMLDDTARIDRLAAGPGQTVPASWIHITSLGRQLLPKQSTLISLELVTPSDAKPGRYVSDVVVTGSAGPPSAGINFGAAAATDLTFTITPGPAAGSWFSFPAWKWLVIGGLALCAAVIGGWRRAGFRIRVERRSTAGSGLNRSGGHHGA